MKKIIDSRNGKPWDEVPSDTQFELPAPVKIIDSRTHINTLSDLCCYTSKTFSIILDGNNLNVIRERDKQIIETVEIGENFLVIDVREDALEKFRALKEKYIFDYDNVL
jgi:hypothetical protein